MNFEVGWAMYAAGFGSLIGEFWLGRKLFLMCTSGESMIFSFLRCLGNRMLHHFTDAQAFEMRVDMWAADEMAYAKYGLFKVASESEKFRLSINRYSGDVGELYVCFSMTMI